MGITNVIETMKRIKFLDGIEQRQLEQLANIAQVSDFDAGDVVFREGQAADSAYLVVSGKLALELTPLTAYRKQLITVGPGEMLGWSSLVELPQFVATAVVVEPAQVIRIDGRRLRSLCDEDPKFGYEFMRRTMRALAKRLTATWSQLTHVYVSQYMPVTAPLEE
jgi:CRP-like cAMP-binding protein